MSEAPKGWTRATIRSRLELEFSGEWGSEPIPGASAARVLRSTNLDDEAHVEYERAAPRRISADKVRQKRLQPGDVLLEASGGGPDKAVGRVALFETQPSDDADYLCSNFFRALRPGRAV